MSFFESVLTLHLFHLTFGNGIPIVKFQVRFAWERFEFLILLIVKITCGALWLLLVTVLLSWRHLRPWWTLEWNWISINSYYLGRTLSLFRFLIILFLWFFITLSQLDMIDLTYILGLTLYNRIFSFSKVPYISWHIPNYYDLIKFQKYAIKKKSPLHNTVYV